MTARIDPAALDYAKGGGFVTVVVQHADTAAVLMVAHADEEAIRRTLATGELHLRSRTRGAWRKGETSGHTMQVVALAADCDADAILALVRPAGPACHTGAGSCFATGVEDRLAILDATIAERVDTPPAPGDPPSYTTRLLADRNLRLKKLGEEAAELTVACADGDPARAAEECADLLYHALVAVRATGATWRDVARLLEQRARDRLLSPAGGSAR